MPTSLKRAFVTLPDYFRLDGEQSERYEYRNGEIFCMGGAQPEHDIICLNIGSELRSRLRHRNCQPFLSDQRVKVNTGSPYLYPDGSVACEPRFTTINGLRTLLNPLLVVEVLSPSTARDDRGAKFLQYQTIASLTDYLLVDSTEVGVLHYAKQHGLWQPQLLEHIQDVLPLASLGIELPLDEIYLGSGIASA